MKQIERCRSNITMRASDLDLIRRGPRALLPGPSLRRQNRRPNVIRSERCGALRPSQCLQSLNERSTVAKAFGLTCNFRPQYRQLEATCRLLRTRS
jgi:hypothetical protein